MTDERVVQIADREATVAELTRALGALSTGRKNGRETFGLPVPMRKVAAEGLADLGFRLVPAAATRKVVTPPPSQAGSHGIAHVEDIDRATMKAALQEFNPAVAAKVADADTEEKRAAARDELRPKVEATLSNSMELGEAVDELRQRGRYETAVIREREG